MKRRFTLFFALFILAANYSYSQSGLSQAIMTSTAQCGGQTIIDPWTNSSRDVFAGLINGTVDGNTTLFYCSDLRRTLSFPDSCHVDSAVSSSYIIYILGNYYPFNPTPAGMLGDLNNEVSATQVAVWHYSDGVDANTVSNSVVRDRALEIIADADANGTSTTQLTTFSIEPGIGFDEFLILTKDQNGNGLAVNNIQLTISQGSLSTNVTNTMLPLGYSDPIAVIGAASGIIQATAETMIMQATTYTCSGRQKMVLAKPVIGKRRVQVDWGALPVELASFNASVRNRDAVLNWSTVTESNNSGFNIERMTTGSNDWKMVGNVAGSGTSNNSHSYIFADRNLESGKYSYRLKQIDFNGNFEYHYLTSEVEIGNPVKFDLGQNYPNPFNPSTKINYDLPADGFTTLKVYNISGKEVAALVSENVTAGYHTINFNASDLPSGVYYYKLESNGFSRVMKMALVK